jgi:oligosaccharide repeat unit polymerase
MSVMLEMLGSAWIPDVFLLGVTAFFCLRNGSWFAPSSFLGLYWFGVLTASLLAMDHPVPGLGIWVLVSLVVAVQVGSAMTETDGKHPLAESSFGPKTSRRLQRVCVALVVMATAGCGYTIWASLDMFGQTFSVASLIQMAAKWTLLKYGGFSDPLALRVAAVWIYPVALLGGVLASSSATRRDKLLGVATLLPSLLFTFLSGGRAAFLLALALWLGGSWAARVACTHGRLKLFSRKAVLSFAALAAGLLLMFAGVNTFRGAEETSNPADLALAFNSGQVRNYMFGSPAAFAEWFDHSEGDPIFWGALSFQGVFDTLHIRQKTLGTYAASERTVGQESTNIYTMFRGLIQDFTLPGAFFICLLWGFFSGRAYANRSLEAKFLLGLSAFYFVALFSPLLSPFAFNSTIFAVALAWFVLRRPAETSLSAAPMQSNAL